MIYLGRYFIFGVIVCGIVAIRHRKHAEDGISALNFLVDGNPLSFFMFLAFWPVLLFAQISDKKELETRKNKPLETRIEKCDLMGHSGCATTDLNPSGKVLVGAISVDAISKGQFIKKDTTVRIVGTTPTGYFVKED